MTIDSSHLFRARIEWWDTDGIVQLELWDDELTPFPQSRCAPTRDWVGDVFRDAVDDDSIREMFGITEPGCYEIVGEFIAHCTSCYCWDYACTEYDAEIEVVSYLKQLLPADYIERCIQDDEPEIL